MRPADDIESLAYVLAFLAAGSLPWQGQPDAVALSMKRELLTGRSALECGEAAAALQALWAEVMRCHAGASLDYEACMAALGGSDAEVDTFSEWSFISALESASEAEAKRAWLRKLELSAPTWGAVPQPTSSEPTSWEHPRSVGEDEARKAWIAKQDAPSWGKAGFSP
jgi:hypothetical protein